MRQILASIYKRCGERDQFMTFEKLKSLGPATIFAFLFLTVSSAHHIKAQAQIYEDSTSTDPFPYPYIPPLVERSFLGQRPSHQLSYQASLFLPQSGLSSYINSRSIQYLGINYQYGFTHSWAFGAELSQTLLSQNLPRATYNINGTNISSVNFRRLNSLQLLPYAQYFFKEATSKLRPFAQLGLGVNYIKYNNFWGQNEDPKERVSPTLSTAIGSKIKLGPTDYWVFDVKAKYVWAPFTYDFITSVNYISIDLALGMRWWDIHTR